MCWMHLPISLAIHSLYNSLPCIPSLSSLYLSESSIFGLFTNVQYSVMNYYICTCKVLIFYHFLFASHMVNYKPCPVWSFLFFIIFSFASHMVYHKLFLAWVIFVLLICLHHMVDYKLPLVWACLNNSMAKRFVGYPRIFYSWAIFTWKWTFLQIQHKVGCVQSLDWTGSDYWTPSRIESSALH